MESEDKKPVFTKKLILTILAVILLILIIFLLLKNCDGSGGGDYKVSYISVSPASFGLKVGQTQQLTATVYPSDAINKTVYWSSSDDSVAIVDANSGLVTAMKEGTVTITACSEDGGRTASSYVVVDSDLPKLTAIQLDKSIYNIKVGGSTLIVVSPAPTTAILPNLIYQIADSNIATVSDNGIIKGVSVGSTTVTVTTIDGLYSATSTVNVTKKATTSDDVILPTTVPVTAVTFQKTNPTQVCVSSILQLGYTITPDNATDKKVIWTLDNPTDKTNMVNKYASISKDGVLTGIAAGSVTITMTSNADNKIFGKTTIKVLAKGSSGCTSSSSGGSSSSSTSTGDGSSKTTTVGSGVTCAVTHDKGNGDWYKRFNVSWSFTPSQFSDDGFSERKYCINGTCTAFSDSYSKYLQSGMTKYIFGYSYKDKDGKPQTGYCNPKSVIYVDTVNPTCTITSSVSDNGTVNAIVTASDETSGVAKIQLNSTSKTYNGDSNFTKTYEEKITFAQNYNQKTYSAIVYDVAGNQGTCSATINRDGTISAARYVKKVNLSFDTSTSIISGQSRSFTASYSMSDNSYTYPSTTNFSVTGGTVSGENGNYVFTADATSKTGKITISGTGYNDKALTTTTGDFKITAETDAPTVTLSVEGTSNNGWYTGAIKITADIHYANSSQGTKSIKLCASNGSTCTPNSSSVSLGASASSGRYVVYYDLVTKGNAHYSKYLGSIKVDNTKPTCSIQKNGDKSIVRFEDNESGLAELYVAGTAVTPNTKKASVHEYLTADYVGKTISAKDAAGNTCSNSFDAGEALKIKYIHVGIDDGYEVYKGSTLTFITLVYDDKNKITVIGNTDGVTASSNNSACFTASGNSENGNVTINAKNTTAKLPCSGKITIASTYDSSVKAYVDVTIKEPPKYYINFNCAGTTTKKECPTGGECDIIPPVCANIDYWATAGGTKFTNFHLTYSKSGSSLHAVLKTDKITKIVLSNLTLVAGEQKQMSATITPSTYTNSNLTWTSSNKTCAIVDASGKVGGAATITSPCTTTITATAGDIKETATVTVNPKALTLAAPSVSFACGTTSYKTGDWCKYSGLAVNVSGVPSGSTKKQCKTSGTGKCDPFTGTYSTITSAGTYTVCAGYTLNNQNSATSCSTITAKFDSTAPYCSSINFANGNITATVVESGSGIASYTGGWSLSGNKLSKTGVLNSGTYSVTIKDSAGNQGNCSIKLYWGNDYAKPTYAWKDRASTYVTSCTPSSSTYTIVTCLPATPTTKYAAIVSYRCENELGISYAKSNMSYYVYSSKNEAETAAKNLSKPCNDSSETAFMAQYSSKSTEIKNYEKVISDYVPTCSTGYELDEEGTQCVKGHVLKVG